MLVAQWLLITTLFSPGHIQVEQGLKIEPNRTACVADAKIIAQVGIDCPADPVCSAATLATVECERRWVVGR